MIWEMFGNHVFPLESAPARLGIKIFGEEKEASESQVSADGKILCHFCGARC
jgi:hypothetical protein